MGLSAMVILALRQEMDVLEAHRAGIAERIAAIRKILESEPEGLTGIVTAPAVDALPEVGPQQSFKSVVHAVLREHPGWKAGDVTAYLRKRHIAPPGGSTPLSHRVYNEIWRMVKSGDLHRTADGGFSPTQ